MFTVLMTLVYSLLLLDCPCPGTIAQGLLQDKQASRGVCYRVL